MGIRARPVRHQRRMPTRKTMGSPRHRALERRGMRPPGSSVGRTQLPSRILVQHLRLVQRRTPMTQVVIGSQEERRTPLVGTKSLRSCVTPLRRVREPVLLHQLAPPPIPTTQLVGERVKPLGRGPAPSPGTKHKQRCCPMALPSSSTDHPRLHPLSRSPVLERER